MKQLVGVLLMVALAAAGAIAQQPSPTVPTPPAAPAPDPDLKPFLDAVEEYLALHHKLHEEIPKLQPNSLPKEITQTSDLLARAIQRSRPKAKQGDFFSKIPATAIKQRLSGSVRDPQLIAGIDDEPPLARAPRVYMRFPEGNQLATMPPTLLRSLPALPPELEYRIVGHFLVLRDTHAAIILDYIPQAIPSRK
jgi:hypothetical protein